MFKTTRLCTAIVLALGAWPVLAAPATVQLQFEGLTVSVPADGTQPRQPVYVDQYYNGGQVRATYDYGPYKAGDSVPSDVPGVDLNIVVSGNSQAVRGYESTQNGGTGNFLYAGLGTGALGLGLDGVAAEARLIVQPGATFNDGFSFHYSALGGTQLSVDLFAGNFVFLHATLSGAASCAGAYAFCNWSPFSSAADLSMAGLTEIVFTGAGFIDNITIGSSDPTTRTNPPNGVPEPGTYALMALGLAAALSARRRARQD